MKSEAAVLEWRAGRVFPSKSGAEFGRLIRASRELGVRANNGAGRS